MAVVKLQTLAAEVAVEVSKHPTPTAEVQVPVAIREPVPTLQAVEPGTDTSEAPIESDPAALVPADEAEVKITLADDEHTTENPLEDEVHQPAAENVSENVDGTDKAEHVSIEAPASTQEEDIQIPVEPPAPAGEVAEIILPVVVKESNEIDGVGDAHKSESVDSGNGESEVPLANGHSTPSEADVTEAPIDTVPTTLQPTPLLSLEAPGEEVARPAPSSEVPEPEVPIIEGDITEAEPLEEDVEPTVDPRERELAAPVDVEFTQAVEPMDAPLNVSEEVGPVSAAGETQVTVEVGDSTVPAEAPAIDPGVVNPPSAADAGIVEPQILGDALELPVEVIENEPGSSAEADGPEPAPAELEIDGSAVDVGSVPVESEVEPVEVAGETSESVIEEAESAVSLGEESKLDHNSEPRTEDVGNEQFRLGTAPAQAVTEAPAEETVGVALEPEDADIAGAALGEDQSVQEPVVSSTETPLVPVALVEVESSQVSDWSFFKQSDIERYPITATIGTRRHESVRRNTSGRIS